MRTPIVVGNWKMNKTAAEAVELVTELRDRVNGVGDVEIGVCPPFVCLREVSKVLEGTCVGLGGQNMHWESKGAYTGEISAEMLLTSGCKYVILGHSERRTYFGETNEGVNKKVKAALSAGLTPIVCVGETLEQRQAGITEQVVDDHVTGGLNGLCGDEVRGLVVAYEPVWAIGTGWTATPEQAQAVHRFIRERLTSLFGAEVAEGLRIQYGGSVNPDNAGALFRQVDLDGGLIGGASLKADSFAAIVQSASEKA